jgi:hypothetical protein
MEIMDTKDWCIGVEKGGNEGEVRKGRQKKNWMLLCKMLELVWKWFLDALLKVFSSFLLLFFARCVLLESTFWN